MSPSSTRTRAGPRTMSDTSEPAMPLGETEGFRQTRAARRAETAEDYVELIADLIDTRGEARAVDIAARLGITQATVTSTVSRLQRDGLVEHRPYRSIFLTEAGRGLAEVARRRHRLVIKFLLTLGISAKMAEQDAEGIEHHVSEETFHAFARFVEANDG
jgi:DtxR family transcriptional regulator, manganese transport regulator